MQNSLYGVTVCRLGTSVVALNLENFNTSMLMYSLLLLILRLFNTFGEPIREVMVVIHGKKKVRTSETNFTFLEKLLVFNLKIGHTWARH